MLFIACRMAANDTIILFLLLHFWLSVARPHEWVHARDDLLIMMMA